MKGIIPAVKILFKGKVLFANCFNAKYIYGSPNRYIMIEAVKNIKNIFMIFLFFIILSVFEIKRAGGLIGQVKNRF